MKQLGKSVANKVIIPTVRHVRPLQTALRYISHRVPESSLTHSAREYERLRHRFIANGRESRYNESIREQIVNRFEVIDQEVTIASTPTDALYLAETILSLDVPGDIVECGCYAGGSSAKLSIVAKVANRNLFVFDSFEGLPAVDDYNIRDHHLRRDKDFIEDWTAGRYAAALDLVQNNVRAFGEISVCRFIKGWFADTLTDDNLPPAIAMAFTDVDIASSAEDCLKGIWPKLSPGGAFYSHDAAYIKVVQALTAEKLWRELFKEPVPILWGAGYGLGDTSPHLGFMVKGPDVSSEYIKSLSMEK